MSKPQPTREALLRMAADRRALRQSLGFRLDRARNKMDPLAIGRGLAASGKQAARDLAGNTTKSKGFWFATAGMAAALAFLFIRRRRREQATERDARYGIL